MSTTKEVTFEELKLHCHSNDAWIGLYGKVYDITSWMKNHPGGSFVLELTAGREATNIFEAYHLLKTKNLIETKSKFIGVLKTTELPIYKNSEFYIDLKQRIEKYFQSKRIRNTKELTKFQILNTFFILAGLTYTYYLSSYSLNQTILSRIFYAILSGLFFHFSMVHIWHDLSHMAYTKNPYIWQYFGNMCDIYCGISLCNWRHRHTVGHHTYTNVAGVDPDLGIYKASPKKPIMDYRVPDTISFPSWFQPIIYLYTVTQMQMDDFISYRRGAMENIKINSKGFTQDTWFYFSKLFFLFHRLILPSFYIGFLVALLVFIVQELASGGIFGFFAQITHISTEMEWPEDKYINKDWGQLQIETARDYCVDSGFWQYLSGYLNCQIVHHLFPGINPHFYPELGLILFQFLIF
eukprot:gene3060-5230_t